jgi:hypothetical protein
MRKIFSAGLVCAVALLSACGANSDSPTSGRPSVNHPRSDAQPPSCTKYALAGGRTCADSTVTP